MKKSHVQKAYLVGFIGPALLIYSIFLLLPILQSVGYSFTDWNGIGKMNFTGLQNYKDIFSDSDLHASIIHSFQLTFWALLIQLPLGIILALLLINNKRKGTKLFKVVFFMPVVLSSAVLAVLWGLIYEPNIGLLNNLLKTLHLSDLTHVWLGETATALPSIIAVVGWQFVGFYMIIYLGAFQNLSPQIIEAAEIDGASSFQQLILIRLPLIKHVISFTIMNCIVGSLKYFDLIYIMTGGGPGISTEVISSQMVKQAFVYGDFGYASTISVLLLVLGIIFAVMRTTLFNTEPLEG